MKLRTISAALGLLFAVFATASHARTIWRCTRDATISIATAPEPGSQCSAQVLDDNAPLLPNVWGKLGVFSAALYQREQDGRTVYSTRNLPGSTKVLNYLVSTPTASPAHAGLGSIGKPQLDVYRGEFKTASRVTGVDEAWLRAIAHAESDYAADAVSAKGAIGVMQLMPEVVGDYRVADPFSAKQSILAGARVLKSLDARYGGDRTLAAAAYNAGPGAVDLYGGVPPYAETQAYVGKVSALYASYRKAMGLDPLSLEKQPAR